MTLIAVITITMFAILIYWMISVFIFAYIDYIHMDPDKNKERLHGKFYWNWYLMVDKYAHPFTDPMKWPYWFIFKKDID